MKRKTATNQININQPTPLYKELFS